MQRLSAGLLRHLPRPARRRPGPTPQHRPGRPARRIGRLTSPALVDGAPPAGPAPAVGRHPGRGVRRRRPGRFRPGAADRHRQRADADGLRHRAAASPRGRLHGDHEPGVPGAPRTQTASCSSIEPASDAGRSATASTRRGSTSSSPVRSTARRWPRLERLLPERPGRRPSGGARTPTRWRPAARPGRRTRLRLRGPVSRRRPQGCRRAAALAGRRAFRAAGLPALPGAATDGRPSTRPAGSACCGCATTCCRSSTDSDDLLVLAQATIPSYLRYGAYPYIVVVRENAPAIRASRPSSTASSGCSPSPRMNANVLEIPLISRRVNDALAMAHRDPSHPGQLLLDIIQTIPRSELFALQRQGTAGHGDGGGRSRFAAPHAAVPARRPARPLRVVPGVSAARPLHHRGAAGDAGHPGPRTRRRQHRLRRAGQRITLGSRAFHGPAARRTPDAGHRHLGGERDPDPGPAHRGGPHLGRPADRARCKTGSIEPGRRRALRGGVPRGLQAGRHAAGRDRRHRDHRRAAGRFGQAGARRPRRRPGRAAHLVPGWPVGVAEPAAADAAVHGRGGARGAAVHGDPPRRPAGVDLPVQDLAAPQHPDAPAGPEREAMAQRVRRRGHRDLARPRRDRPVQRTGAARRPDLAAGRRAARLREIPAAGRVSRTASPTSSR